LRRLGKPAGSDSKSIALSTELRARLFAGSSKALGFFPIPETMSSGAAALLFNFGEGAIDANI
jgi:hypothetical protein